MIEVMRLFSKWMADNNLPVLGVKIAITFESANAHVIAGYALAKERAALLPGGEKIMEPIFMGSMFGIPFELRGPET